MPRIPLKLKSNIILLDALVKGKRGSRLLQLVLDSGASVSTIPFEVALSIGVDPTRSNKKIPIMTASSLEYALHNIHFVCMDLPTANNEIQGLLGLNVLEEFDVFLGFRKRILEITR